jgi:anti-anti-sigma factor
MEEKNEITLEKQNSVTVFDVKGDITAHSEPYFIQAYKEANDQDSKKILFKFEDGAYINSGGIAVLIQILAETNRNQQDTGIIGLSDHFKKIFNMVGITKFARIYDSIEEGLAQMSEDA